MGRANMQQPKRRRGKQKDGRHNEEDASSLGYKPHRSLLIHSSEEGFTWYNTGSQIPGRNETVFDVEMPSAPQNSELVSKYRSLADDIYRIEVNLDNASSHEGGTSSDARWVENTMKKGTLKDRIAATSVLVSTDPVHKLSTLDNLLNMAGCNDSGQPNSRVAQMAAEALEDLFLNTLLPPGRGLLSLDQRPLAFYDTSANKTLSPRVLLLWRYEDMLKQRYQAFLNSYLFSTLRDGMELNKVFALRTAGTLLRSTPEGEAQLLTMMVNKLGDPGKKIAAAASHELRRILEQHENMQEVVAREVQQLAHRPQLSPRALYNCIVFLNQLKLQKGTQKTETGNGADSSMLPVSLLNTYFRMFDVAVNTRTNETMGMKSRLLSALLTGINRAHPYLPDKNKGLEDHMDALYNVAHTAPPSASTQALMLLFHVAVGQGSEESNENQKKGRFYRALYAKLAAPAFLSGGKHLTMFFNLLYKAMKNDTDLGRVVAFSKRLMCTIVHSSPSLAAAALFLLNELMKTHQTIAVCLNEIPSNDSAQLGLDPVKREPRAAIVNLENGQAHEANPHPPMWEICLLANHYHPSAGKFADVLGSIDYSGDPLKDFTLAPFLDKFSYRNPKSVKKGMNGIAERKIDSQVTQPVNDPRFLRQENVDASEKFFHNFFTERARRDKINGLTRGKCDEQDDEDEAFDVIEQHQIDQVFEGGDSTDPEEEEFANKLAMNLMRTSGQGRLDFDDEDPDMDDWGDLNEDDDQDNQGGDNLEDSLIKNQHQHKAEREKDVFAADEDDSDDSGPQFPVAYDNDSDESHLVQSGASETGGDASRKAEADVFVDADQYEAIIQQAIHRRKRDTNTQNVKQKKQKLVDTS